MESVQYFSLNRTDHVCRYMAWRYDVMIMNSWGSLLEEAPRLEALFRHLNCNVWCSISAIFGAFLNKNSQYRPPAPPSEVERVVTCAELRATFLKSDQEQNGYASNDGIFSRRNEKGVALWVSNMCDLTVLEAEMSQNLEWAKYLFSTKITPLGRSIDEGKDEHETTERFLLWDYVWQLNDVGKHAGYSRFGKVGRWSMGGFGNIFWSVTTAVVTAALTNRTLVLPPSRINWSHTRGFSDLADALQFSSFSSSSAIEGHVKVISWSTFVKRMYTDPKYEDNAYGKNLGSLCNEAKDNYILDFKNHARALVWFDVPNPTAPIHYDVNGNPSPVSLEFRAAKQFSKQHSCTHDFKQTFDPECDRPGRLHLAPLPGIFDENGRPLNPRPTFLYIPAAIDAYWTRFGGFDRQRTLQILHRTIKLHDDVEALAKEVVRTSFGPQELGKMPSYDCIQIRRGDLLNGNRKMSGYPAAFTSIDEEAKRAADHLYTTKRLPVYVAMENSNILSKEDKKILESRLKSQVVYSPTAKKRVCDAIQGDTEHGRVERESCARVGMFIDIAVCRDARRFVGSFKSTYTGVIQEFRLRKWNEKKLWLINGPTNEDSPGSFLSWYY